MQALQKGGAGGVGEPLESVQRRILGTAKSRGPAPQQQDVEDLLKDYQAWHAPFGGAGEINLQAMGQYGPAGIIFAGMPFSKRERLWLMSSYQALDEALAWLKREHFTFWLVLLKPYLGDPADPSVVQRWRKNPDNNTIKYHDIAIRLLCEYLKDVELFSIGAKKMSEEEDGEIEHQYAEMVAVFERLRLAGASEKAAIRQTAEMSDVPPDTVERVLEFRHAIRRPGCRIDGCERTAHGSRLCMMHYQQMRRKGERGRAG